jgi:hypothetical protein
LNWHVNLPDTSNLDFFRQHPHISKIDMTVVNDKVEGISLIFKDKNERGNEREAYSTYFKGDVLVFQDRYKKPISWVIPRFYTNDINGDYVGYMYDHCSSSIYPDSVIFRYYEHHLLSENKKQKQAVGGGGPFTPSFVGKIQDLADSITVELAKTGYEDTGESVVVFEGIVERNGKLQDLEQVFGDSTLFSETVAFCLLKDYPDIRRFKRGMWHPSIADGRPMRARIRIYAELREGELYVEPSRGFYGWLPD